MARFEKGQKTYIYYFDRRPPGHDSDHYGAYHSAELVYVFNNLDSVKRPWTETDRKLADTMSSYWVNFAKSGDPNHAGLPHWPAFGATPARGLELGAEVKPATMPPTERLDALKKEGFDLDVLSTVSPFWKSSQPNSFQNIDIKCYYTSRKKSDQKDEEQT